MKLIIPNEEAAKEVFKILAKRDYNIILKDSDVLHIWCDNDEETNMGVWFLETKNQKLVNACQTGTKGYHMSFDEYFQDGSILAGIIKQVLIKYRISKIK